MRSADAQATCLIRIFESLWRLQSFRNALQIKEIVCFGAGCGYYVCPRCAITLDRDFVAYCDRCGQKLDWSEYKHAKIIYPGKR